MKLPIQELDIVYISYDEPKCEEFYNDLLQKAPWAKRVHGVKGFDSAHKEAARLSDTERFITVDGDNRVDVEFFQEILEFEKEEQQVFSWSAKNYVNGLVYGNGGLKCWHRDVVLNMNTHEISNEEGTAVDFCWDLNYIQMNDRFSTVYANGSPFQAFRAGFREGVKMTLDQGNRVSPSQVKTLHYKNVQRLIIWTNIGSDVENGIWSVYGARLGCYLTTLTNWNFHQIRDYDWFKKYWTEEIAPKFEGTDEKCLTSKYAWNREKLHNEIATLGDKIKKGLGLPMIPVDSEYSSFFKALYINPPRIGTMITEREMQKYEEVPVFFTKES